MALSNWDILAFGTDGQPCNGVLKGFNDATVEIYKSYIHVGDKNMWHEDCGYVNNIVAVINEGSIDIAGFNIHACRVPQEIEGIFMYAECAKYTEKDGNTERQIYRMAGVGCYGFDDSKWVGVTEEIYESFMKWLCEETGKHTEYDKDFFEWVKTCDKNGPLRFCQGDKYFADNIEGLDLPATPPGEAEQPMIMDIIKGKDKE